MNPLPLFNLKDFQFPPTFTVTPSKWEERNRQFWEEVPKRVLKDYKTRIDSKVQLALIQHALLVRRNKFKVDLWFDGPRAKERRNGLHDRMMKVNDKVLMSQPVYQEFK